MRIKEKIELENAKTEYKLLRPDLLTPALRIFSENKDNEYPQKIFEIGTSFGKENSGGGISEKRNLLIALSPGNFTEIKQILECLSGSLSLNFKIKEKKSNHFIEGRTASILLNGKEAGHFGEINPETLIEFGIKMPIAALEISLEEIFSALKENHPK